MLGIFPIADALSGIALEGSISYGQKSLPIGILFRLVLFALILISLALYRRWNWVTIILLISYASNIILILMQAVVYDYGFSQLYDELSVFGKYLTWAMIAAFFYGQRTLISPRTVRKMLYSSNFFLVLGLIVPKLLGTGTSTYDGTVGFKGWYYGPNDTTYCLAMLTIFLILKMPMKWPHRENILLAGLFVFDLYGLLMIGTKSSFAAIVVSIVIFLCRMVKNWHVMTSVTVLLMLLTSSLLVFYFRGQHIYQEIFVPNINRLVYFYDQYNGDMVRLIFSNRTTHVTEALHMLRGVPNSSVINLIGYGYDFRQNIFGVSDGLIEMDFIDTLFSYGLLGGVMLFAYLITLGTHIRWRRDIVTATLVILTFVYANVAGHVLYSSMAGTTLGMLIGHLVVEGKEKEKDEAQE